MFTSNNWRTISSKFDSECRRCKGAIKAGTKIRWAPGKGAWHLSDDCAVKPAATVGKRSGALSVEEMQAKIAELEAMLEKNRAPKSGPKVSKRDAAIQAALSN